MAEGRFPEASRGMCLQGNPQDAASHPASAMPRESTLGGRDAKTIILGKRLSKNFGAVPREAMDILVIGTASRSSSAAKSDRYRTTAINSRSSRRETRNSRYSFRRSLIANGIAPETNDSTAVMAVVATSGPIVPFASKP